MKALYESDPVRLGLGPCLRPGGLLLTERILDLVAPTPAARILDAGCGSGASMALFRDRGLGPLIGLDMDATLLGEARRDGHAVAGATLTRLPLPDNSVAMVLCECAWGMTDRNRVLAEFARVLRPGAVLALTDIYARNGTAAKTPWPVRCCFSLAPDIAGIEAAVIRAGFTLTIFEDHTRLLQQTAAEFVFHHGSLHAFWEAVTGDAGLATAACTAASAVRPGFFLLIAQRRDT